MLKILDRYILKKYLGTFFFIVLMFSMLASVIDFAEKVEDFVGEKAPSWNEILFDYYLNFIPFINSLLFPLYTLITVIFFTSRMASNSEIIGMLGNGVNFYRILVPYVIAGSLITGLHLVGNHYIFPNSSKSRVRFENTYVWRNNFNSASENIHFMLDARAELYIHQFNRKDSTGRGIWLIQYDSTGTKRAETMVAKTLKSLGGSRWQFRDYYVRTVDDMKEKISKAASKDTTINLKMSDIVRRDNDHQAMTTPELEAYIEQARSRGMAGSIMHEVEKHRRSADPFTNLILTVIGFAIASRKTRGGMGWHLVIGILVSGLFIFMTKFSTTFATNAGFSPMVAIWLPNIIFTGVALYMLKIAQK